MFTNVYPNFTKGRILKRDMLESLRDDPRRFTELSYQAYSDGILAGAEVRITAENLIVSSGLVKFGSRIYALEQDYSLSYSATGRETVLKIRFREAVAQLDFTLYNTDIVLDDDISLRGNELELGRFKLKEGAKLRSDYQSFADCATEYNTWNSIYTAYSALGQSSLSPALTRYFGAQLLSAGSSNAYDIAFAMQCLNQGTVNRDLILHYIGSRLGTGYKAYDNVHIHKYLTRILEETQGGTRAKPDLRPGAPRRMIVD
ncbi:DNA and RNA helicase [Paenibacillus sp. SYP-B3998]|uniref:DNA and RNA helicase n=1 Tax=Paenibacillus sp. SYP-B3998 TaxID=2678564 RepID=A0A6G4A849_9BACL|nr:DNA and RNA helicase [Paenibacillus sp. SYP-B3998]NEW09797.1 DNA and RNA helicase [Paenibacillus sp. SYP-B3998]